MPPFAYTEVQFYTEGRHFSMKKQITAKKLGTILALLGVSMVISLMLPFWFWWLLIGVALLCAGIKLIRCG